METIERVRAVIAAVRKEFAPDPRLSVFEVAVVEDGRSFRVFGSVSDPAAAEVLSKRLALLDGSSRVRHEIERLPLSKGGVHALVNAALAPVLAGPVISEAHISQAILGHHLLVLRERGRWLNVRTEDGYLGWMHRGYVRRVEEPEARMWKLGAEYPVYISLGAEIRDSIGDLVARLPWGARFLVDGEEGILPSGLRGRIVGESISAADRPTRFPAEGSAIAHTAAGWIGTPYLWGGVTPAGVDCSGFVQAIFRMHGVQLPRDSDQQAKVGISIPLEAATNEGRAGDLLFFAEQPGRVSHVGISLGGSRLIHSALGIGGVSRNDLRGSTAFERELRRLLVGVCRVVPDALSAR